MLEEKPADDLSIFQKEPALWTMSVACAASIMLALFAGHRVALSLLPPMMVLGSISVFVGPLVSMRGVVFITAVFQVRRTAFYSSRPNGLTILRRAMEER